MFAGKVFALYRTQVVLPDGGRQMYESIVSPDVVRVYPVTAAGVLLMIDEFRGEVCEPVLRVVSGQIGGHETPGEAAARELSEELGYRAESLVLFATSTANLALESTIHHVLATDLRSGRRRLERGEDVTVRPVALGDIEALVWSGAVREDVIALNLLRLVRIHRDMYASERESA